jgi:5-(carboxyamino)imidazole ribonucleotide mutase
MPKGVPVATVAIDGAENAALLAVQILSVKYPELRAKMKDYKIKMEQEIIKQDHEFNA